MAAKTGHDQGSFMSGVHPKFVSFLSLILLFLLTETSAPAAERPLPRKRVLKQEQPAPAPQPPPPPAPLTLEQMPASAPQVIFRDGRLTISAQNSTLGDVLRAVRAQTGADLEIPANATERVVSHLGPGPAREVLAALLNGSHFNYVLLGSAVNPNLLDRVILLPKTGGASEAGSAYQANAGQMANPEPQAQNPVSIQPAQESEEMSNDDFGDDNMSDFDTPADQTTEGRQQPNLQPNGVKTPEQLLQELQRQQMQQQPGAPQGFPRRPGLPAGQPQPDQPPPPQ